MKFRKPPPFPVSFSPRIKPAYPAPECFQGPQPRKTGSEQKGETKIKQGNIGVNTCNPCYAASGESLYFYIPRSKNALKPDTHENETLVGRFCAEHLLHGGQQYRHGTLFHGPKYRGRSDTRCCFRRFRTSAVPGRPPGTGNDDACPSQHFLGLHLLYEPPCGKFRTASASARGRWRKAG